MHRLDAKAQIILMVICYVVFGIIMLVIADVSDRYYDDGTQLGFEEGYNDGFAYWYDEGYDEGYYFGKNEGFDEGYGKAYEEGYSDGFEDANGGNVIP